MRPPHSTTTTATTTATPAATTPATRLHGLDALRAGALLLGIVLHSLMPFLPDGWLVIDRHTSPAAVVAVTVIHLFRMVLFMMLAGYFGRMVLHRRGVRAYLRDRGLRILAPLPYLATLLLQDASPDSGIEQPTTVLPEPVPLIGFLGAFVVGWCR